MFDEFIFKACKSFQSHLNTLNEKTFQSHLNTLNEKTFQSHLNTLNEKTFQSHLNTLNEKTLIMFYSCVVNYHTKIFLILLPHGVNSYGMN